MPRGNGTGPMGQGPMTGRGAGFCAGYGVPGYANPSAPGYGFGRGRGGFGGFFGRGGRARGYGYNASFNGGFQPPVTAANEKEILSAQESYLAKELEAIRTQISELNAKPMDN